MAWQMNGQHAMGGHAGLLAGRPAHEFARGRIGEAAG